MKKNDLFKTALINSLGTVAYISLVAMIMTFAEKIFGQTKSIIAPISFLLLFVVSAATTGYLVLGQSILLYLDNKKEEALKLFGYTILCLSGLTICALLINFIL